MEEAAPSVEEVKEVDDASKDDQGKDDDKDPLEEQRAVVVVFH